MHVFMTKIFYFLILIFHMQKGNDQGMFRQLDEILYVDGYPGYQYLMSVAENSMRLVCEVKGDCLVSVLRIFILYCLTFLFYTTC